MSKRKSVALISRSAPDARSRPRRSCSIPRIAMASWKPGRSRSASAWTRSSIDGSCACWKSSSIRQTGACAPARSLTSDCHVSAASAPLRSASLPRGAASRNASSARRKARRNDGPSLPACRNDSHATAVPWRTNACRHCNSNVVLPKPGPPLMTTRLLSLARSSRSSRLVRSTVWSRRRGGTVLYADVIGV
ncbi:hypothetical protein D3C81_781420 [compost metagenome]